MDMRMNELSLDILVINGIGIGNGNRNRNRNRGGIIILEYMWRASISDLPRIFILSISDNPISGKAIGRNVCYIIEMNRR